MLDAMQQHIEQLCHENDIWWKPWLKRSDKAYAISLEDSERWDIREILTAPIRSTISYATALHEIGHYLGRYQRRKYRTVTREAWAWEWARQNALVLDGRNGTVRDQRGRRENALTNEPLPVASEARWWRERLKRHSSRRVVPSTGDS